MPALNLSALKPHDIIDITPQRERGVELHTIICNAVKDTQSAAMLMPLPNVLVMTEQQFDSLDPEGNLLRMQGADGLKRTEGRIYRTPDNIMEVHIKDLAPKSSILELS